MSIIVLLPAKKTRLGRAALNPHQRRKVEETKMKHTELRELALDYAPIPQSLQGHLVHRSNESIHKLASRSMEMLLTGIDDCPA
jgi:hypothetical protein